MYIYIYIYIYVYVLYIDICICVYIYIYIYVYPEHRLVLISRTNSCVLFVCTKLSLRAYIPWNYHGINMELSAKILYDYLEFPWKFYCVKPECINLGFTTL